MTMKEIVLITGANGMVAKKLSQILEKKYTLRFLTRTKRAENHFEWDIEKKYIDDKAVQNVSHVIHLAGAGVADKKWTPQSKDEILNLLTNFLEHFNLSQDDLSPLINLAILHYQFESIHPFYDGNGRTGRVLNILYLIINDLLDIPILYLSSYINENKSDYYRLLNKVNKHDEWEEYILYILKAIEVTATSTIKKINLINNLLQETIQVAKEKAPKIYRKELIELLFEEPYSKIDYVVKRLKVERKAASRYLRKLEEVGILKSQKISREYIYLNVKLIQILKKA